MLKTMWGRAPRLAGQAGMTLIEIMVTTLVLVVGLGGVLTLVAQANRSSDASSARVTANNLAREVLEDARGVDYDLLTPSAVAPALQAYPGLAGTGSPWTVTRRGLAYTIKVNPCTFDDPRDGLANGGSVPAPLNECLPRATAETGVPTEANPDDFRRVDVTISWRFRNVNRSITLTDSIVNPSGGLGPRITSITQPASQISGGNSVSIPVATTPNAATVHWIVDTTSTEGDAAGGSTSWSINWDIKAVGAAGAVLDGTYTVNAQPFDARGVPGDTRPAIVQVNRSLPFAPTGLSGGRNDAFGSTVVDLDWNGNLEKDLVGYRVYRTDPSGTVKLVCGTVAAPLNALRCTDTSAPSLGTLTYRVYAVDRTDITDVNSVLREGAASAPLTVGPTGAATSAPTNLQATVVNNLAHLTWTPPSTGTVAFYRIYRDGQQVSDRLARTASNAAVYDDSTWGSPGHRYWVTAVTSSYSESPPSNRADL